MDAAALNEDAHQIQQTGQMPRRQPPVGRDGHASVDAAATARVATPLAALSEAAAASEAGAALSCEMDYVGGYLVPVVQGEFWTARQRQAARLHEISYRACFKPQLPAFFIERFTAPGDLVYDPFSGRGTTAIEAALRGRQVAANDVNPLSALLTSPRLSPPDIDDVAMRLDEIAAFQWKPRARGIDVSMFYHVETAAEIERLRAWLLRRDGAGETDDVDRWIRMVATNRLTGHSPGFFSVYTLPPNQAVTAERQVVINKKRAQVPTYRDTATLILKKSRALLSGLTNDACADLRKASRTARMFTGDARRTPKIRKGSVALTVTSPPFLDVVNYADDNWLRCWFNGIDDRAVADLMTTPSTLPIWTKVMSGVMDELFRITKIGGVVAFEVGEVRGGRVRLEEHVVPLAIAAGFILEAVMINTQSFTKTSNIWGVTNNARGTNSNRIVVLRK